MEALTSGSERAEGWDSHGHSSCGDLPHGGGSTDCTAQGGGSAGKGGASDEVPEDASRAMGGGREVSWVPSLGWEGGPLGEVGAAVAGEGPLPLGPARHATMGGRDLSRDVGGVRAVGVPLALGEERGAVERELSAHPASAGLPGEISKAWSVATLRTTFDAGRSGISVPVCSGGS